ncbi:unnamed protein product [Mytilus coruscus]|uniref:CUB domain-containing protein n=1 Tax=Mytilus coruscus TaxID=42192 RepID=A0A6J8AMQ6_MYTCO|nr:unnamed protein product [Mytilus coruscus]
MCVPLFLLSALLACPLVSAFNKTVGFKKEDCEEYRLLMYNAGDVYNIIWDGEEYPKFCSLRFKMVSADSYELCAKVTEFRLECSDFKLKFYWGVSMNLKIYDCYSSLPIKYCNEDLLFMSLEPYYYNIRHSNSNLRITVTANLLSKYGEEDSSNGGVIAGVIGSIFIVCLVCFVCILVNKRKAASESIMQGTRQQDNDDVITMPQFNGNEWRQQNPEQRNLMQHTGIRDANQVTYNQYYQGPESYPGARPTTVSEVEPSASPIVSDISAPPPLYESVISKGMEYEKS